MKQLISNQFLLFITFFILLAIISLVHCISGLINLRSCETRSCIRELVSQQKIPTKWFISISSFWRASYCKVFTKCNVLPYCIVATKLFNLYTHTTVKVICRPEFVSYKRFSNCYSHAHLVQVLAELDSVNNCVTQTLLWDYPGIPKTSSFVDHHYHHHDGCIYVKD